MLQSIEISTCILGEIRNDNSAAIHERKFYRTERCLGYSSDDDIYAPRLVERLSKYSVNFSLISFFQLHQDN